jgi:hypothetical protein
MPCGNGWQREPFDPSVAAQAMARADTIARGMDAVGAETLIAGLPRVDDLCTYCPFFDPAADGGAARVWDGCPGAGRPAGRSGRLAAELIGEPV